MSLIVYLTIWNKLRAVDSDPTTNVIFFCYDVIRGENCSFIFWALRCDIFLVEIPVYGNLNPISHLELDSFRLSGMLCENVILGKSVEEKETKGN